MEHHLVREDFKSVRHLYDHDMADNMLAHDLIYPDVFGVDEYIGQFSDNSASELLLMAEAMRLPRNSNVVDVGCGRGRVASFLALKQSWRITGIDLGYVPISHARKTEGCEFIRANIYDHEFATPFDGAYGTGSFCHFNARRLFRRLRTLIRPGGTLGFMERVRRGDISSAIWQRLTDDWHCPFIYSDAEYSEILTEEGFSVITTVDLTPSFRNWQQRSVDVRLARRQELLELTSPNYFDLALRLAQFEADATAAGSLGYALIVAQREP